MKLRQGITTAVLGVTAAIVVSACNSTSEGTGSLSLNITDAPVDGAQVVWVEFTGLSIKHENERAQEITFDEPRGIDLLALQGDAFEALFTDREVTAGRYNWIRLHVNAKEGVADSYIEIDGHQHSLYVPSGDQTGLKLVSGFNVPRNGSAAFTIDFDLRKSIVKPQNESKDYFLKPALRLVDNAQVGHISGNVRLDDFSCGEVGNAVYVYEGHDVTPTDTDIDTVASALVAHDGENYSYSVGFLTAGSYTLALSCNADQDDNEFGYKAEKNVEVTAGETTTANFPVNAE